MTKLLGLLLKRAPWKLVLAVVLGLAAGAANMLALHAIQLQIAAAGTHQASFRSIPAIVWFFGAVAGRLICGFISGLLIRGLSHDTLTRLRVDIAERLTAISLVQMEELGPARVHHLFADEIGRISEGVVKLPSMIYSGALLVASLVYLAWLAPITLLVALAGMGGGVALELLGHRLAKGTTANTANSMTALQHQIGGVIDGGKELRVHEPRRLHFLRRELAPAAERARQALMTSVRWDQLLSTASTGMMWLTLGLVLFVAPALGGSSPVTAVVVLFLIAPFSEFTAGWSQAMHGSFAFSRVESLIRGMSSESEARPEPPAFDEQIELRKVEFTYLGDRGDRYRLGPIDLSLRRGELLFLIGGNGSGKTTLAKLLTGFYAPMAGEMRIDDRPLDGESARANYRQLFSIIFGNFYVFPWILDASPARDAKAVELLAKLGLGEVVRVQDGRFVTTELSTGQKKRFALAAALLDDRPIYLFDEWAADQDPSWKQLFYEELLPQLKASGKTIIVVTHDDRYFACADRVVKMENGRVASDSRPAGN